MEITTVTTKVVWSMPRGVELADKIVAMIQEVTEAGELISRSKKIVAMTQEVTEAGELISGSEVTYTSEAVIAVWRDLAAANEYLAFVNTLSPISAKIIEN